jgi:hypothetical protein
MQPKRDLQFVAILNKRLYGSCNNNNPASTPHYMAALQPGFSTGRRFQQAGS